MRKILKRLNRYRYPYKPLIQISLSRANLRQNLYEYRKIAKDWYIAPVLKSNAYGHGLIEIAEILKEDSDIPFFVIDTYFEAIILRNNGIRTPLLIIGYTPVETILYNHLKNISFSLADISVIKEITRKARKYVELHIKIDTGMHRQGISIDEISNILDIMHTNKYLQISGIFSHFSDADNIDDAFTCMQIDKWNSVVNTIKSRISTIKYIHISNTAGHKYFHKINANTSRLGLGLYGLDNNIIGIDMKPVLQMKTVISGIKNIHKGDTVGYNNTFTAKKDMKIATIPVGYFEGLDRRLSNKGSVIIHSKPCHIIGRISMNITIVDVTHLSHIDIGDEVIVISNNKSDINTVANISNLVSTIPYDLIVHIPAHLKRVIV